MLPGVYLAKKTNGTLYYRSSITYLNKHISLGSFSTEKDASQAYVEARHILSSDSYTMENIFYKAKHLTYDKLISLINFRDNLMYIKNPIYLHKNFFVYYLTKMVELKFDIDDLFYYSSHKILHRQGHLFVNDYGMQFNILSRYGIHNYAVAGYDYLFANGDNTDFRYSNIIILNKYYGVHQFEKKGKLHYKTVIHINGNYTIGSYTTPEKAAIAYNKAVDLARTNGLNRNFMENYVDNFTAKEYADIYTKIKISPKYLEYLKTL